MHKCNKCAHEFDTPAMYGQKLTGPWEDSYPGDEVCPKCGSDDFEEVEADS